MPVGQKLQNINSNASCFIAEITPTLISFSTLTTRACANTSIFIHQQAGQRVTSLSHTAWQWLLTPLQPLA